MEKSLPSAAEKRIVIGKAGAPHGVKGEMKIIHVNDMIMEVFEVTGFSDILTIE